MDSIAELLIKQLTDQLKLDNYYIKTEVINVDSDNIDVEFTNDYYLLVSKSIDIPETAKLTISSNDNLIIRTRAEYDNYNYANLQMFHNNMNITLQNYGTTFTPFQLEFIRIIPTR